jgi:glycosyltransferase involved in cell wall biosynthesis
MKVLFVSGNFPSDLRTHVHGTRQRMGMFIEAIGGIADLDILFYVHPHTDVSPSTLAATERYLSGFWNAEIRLSVCPRSQDSDQLSRWQLYGAPALSIFSQSGYRGTSGPEQVKAFEACLLRRPDAIFAHRLDAMCPVLQSKQTLPPTYFDLDDLEHVAQARAIDRTSSSRDQLAQYCQIPPLWWAERRATRLARRTFVCSDLDREYLERRCRFRNVVTIPNGVNVAKPSPVVESPTVMFLGTYKHQPNIQAAELLLNRIWPLIHQKKPNARLIIAGAWPENIPGYGRAGNEVEFTGFVDDLDRLYERSRIACAPILTGSGTRVKIIEAAAHGKPVVSTSIGAEGLLLRDGAQLLIRDNPAAFADACITLLDDTALCSRLGAAARETVRKHYSRDAIVRLIRSHLDNAASATDLDRSTVMKTSNPESESISRENHCDTSH